MQWHFGSGTLVPPVGFDSNNNQILAFSGTKVRNISYFINLPYVPALYL